MRTEEYKNDISTPLISIIVPVYQIKNYLPTCIESICAQTFSDWELLLIDDGSKDGGEKLCDEYAKSDDRIKVVHQENGGVSAARNHGLDLAKGEYIVFVDGDDYIASDYLEILYNIIAKYDVDIVCSNWAEILGEKKECMPIRIIEEEKLLRGNEKVFEDSMNAILEGKGSYMGIVCAKLFRRSKIGEQRFQNYKYGEDTLFMYTLLAKGVDMYLHTVYGYFYVRREDSATMQQGQHFDIERAIQHIQVYKHIYYNLSLPELAKKGTARIFGALIIAAMRVTVSSDQREIYDQYAAYLKEEGKALLKSGVLPSLKQCIGILLYNVVPFKVFCKVVSLSGK